MTGCGSGSSPGVTGRWPAGEQPDRRRLFRRHRLDPIEKRLYLCLLFRRQRLGSVAFQQLREPLLFRSGEMGLQVRADLRLGLRLLLLDPALY